MLFLMWHMKHACEAANKGKRMNIRKATAEDVELLVRLRIDYLTADYGTLEESAVTAIRKQLRDFLPRALPTESFIAFLAEENGEVAATAFLVVEERPANPTYLTGKVGTVMNVLTYPQYRRQGFSSRVLRALIDEAKRSGVSAIELSATVDGRPVYEKLGFKPVERYTAMKLVL